MARIFIRPQTTAVRRRFGGGGLVSMPSASPVGEVSVISELGAHTKNLRGFSVKGYGGLASKFQGVQIDPGSIAAVQALMMNFDRASAEFGILADHICAIFAGLVVANAQKRSLGPIDPSMTNTEAAWKIPVRRITGAYLAGWTLIHPTLGHWQVTNTSREAYFIEFGINHQSTTGAQGPNGQRVRIRRPILKLSLLAAVRAVKETGVAADEMLTFVMPAGIYQSPYITGAIRRKGPTGSYGGLVDMEKLRQLATTA